MPAEAYSEMQDRITLPSFADYAYFNVVLSYRTATLVLDDSSRGKAK
jgi:hypothetical protein